MGKDARCINHVVMDMQQPGGRAERKLGPRSQSWGRKKGKDSREQWGQEQKCFEHLDTHICMLELTFIPA